MLVVNARFLTRQITGAQRYAIEIARELVRQEPSVRLLGPPDIVHPELAEELGSRRSAGGPESRGSSSICLGSCGAGDHRCWLG